MAGLRRFGTGFLAGAALAAAVLPAGPARGQQAPAFGASGDWDGLRTRLYDRGLDFQIQGLAEGAYNPTGGVRQSATSAEQFNFGRTADLGKLAGLTGGTAQLMITKRDGANVDTSAGLPVLQQNQEIWGRGNIWRLTELSYEQELFDQVLDLKAGRVTPGDDFDILSCDFQNMTFCNAPAGNIEGDYWFDSPVGQWGARVQVNLPGSTFAKGGVYQISQRNLVHGFDLSFGGGEGVLSCFEVGWTPSLGRSQLPGLHTIGG